MLVTKRKVVFLNLRCFAVIGRFSRPPFLILTFWCPLSVLNQNSSTTKFQKKFGTFRHFSARRRNIFIVANNLIMFGILCFMPLSIFIKFHITVLSQIEKRTNVLFTHFKFELCIKIAYVWELRISISRAPFNIFRWIQNWRIEWDDFFQINFTLKIRKILSFRSYDVIKTPRTAIIKRTS